MKNGYLFLSLILALGNTALPAQAAEVQAATPNNTLHIMLAIVAFVQVVAIAFIGTIFKRLADNPGFLMKLRKLKEEASLKSGLVLVLVFGISLHANAQDVAGSASFIGSVDSTTWALFSLNLFLLVVLLFVSVNLRKSIESLMPEPEVAKKLAAPANVKIMNALTDAVPVEEEEEILLDHEYDGIHELDNNLPPWWVALFYVTIVFAFVYVIYFHVLPFGPSQNEEYLSEVEDARVDHLAYLALAKDLVDENTVALLLDPSDLAAGSKIFMANCQACHAADGGGGVGPNLTDSYWVHGGSISNIFSTIKYGVPAKGMISWQSQLKPIEMAQVASYIHQMHGTTPLNPKEPEGVIYEEVGSAIADSSAVIELIDSLVSPNLVVK